VTLAAVKLEPDVVQVELAGEHLRLDQRMILGQLQQLQRLEQWTTTTLLHEGDGDRG
jgi:hypothetical protein